MGSPFHARGIPNYQNYLKVPKLLKGTQRRPKEFQEAPKLPKGAQARPQKLLFRAQAAAKVDKKHTKSATKVQQNCYNGRSPTFLIPPDAFGPHSPPPGGPISPSEQVLATQGTQKASKIEPKGLLEAPWGSAITMVFTVWEPSGEVLGRLQEVTFFRLCLQTLPGGVLGSLFADVERFWAPFGVPWGPTAPRKTK